MPKATKHRFNVHEHIFTLEERFDELSEMLKADGLGPIPRDPRRLSVYGKEAVCIYEAAIASMQELLAAKVLEDYEEAATRDAAIAFFNARKEKRYRARLLEINEKHPISDEVVMEEDDEEETVLYA